MGRSLSSWNPLGFVLSNGGYLREPCPFVLWPLLGWPSRCHLARSSIGLNRARIEDGSTLLRGCSVLLMDPYLRDTRNFRDDLAVQGWSNLSLGFWFRTDLPQGWIAANGLCRTEREDLLSCLRVRTSLHLSQTLLSVCHMWTATFPTLCSDCRKGCSWLFLPHIQQLLSFHLHLGTSVSFPCWSTFSTWDPAFQILGSSFHKRHKHRSENQQRWRLSQPLICSWLWLSGGDHLTRRSTTG